MVCACTCLCQVLHPGVSCRGSALSATKLDRPAYGLQPERQLQSLPSAISVRSGGMLGKCEHEVKCIMPRQPRKAFRIV